MTNRGTNKVTSGTQSTDLRLSGRRRGGSGRKRVEPSHKRVEKREYIRV